jgi:hypothetical protein
VVTRLKQQFATRPFGHRPAITGTGAIAIREAIKAWRPRDRIIMSSEKVKDIGKIGTQIKLFCDLSEEGGIDTVIYIH